MISLIITQIRVHQWIKNLLMFAPLLFSRKLLNLDSIERSVLAFFAFCFVASAIYVLNDIKDIETDKHHPVKKNRPLASGQLSLKTGILLVIICLSLSAMFLYFLGDWKLIAILALYVFMNVLYSSYFKHVSIVDCIFISIGFELRIIAGCEAINVQPSDFILVVTFFLALMLGFIKRKGELKVMTGSALSHRKVLAEYSVELMDKYIYSCSTMTLISYMFYTIDENVISLIGNDFLKYSLIFVVYGLFRFIQLADIGKYQHEGDPTTLILKDRPLQFTLLLFLLFISYCFYGQTYFTGHINF